MSLRQRQPVTLTASAAAPAPAKGIGRWMVELVFVSAFQTGD